MATIRERVKADGTRIFHVQVRMTGFPARTASFPTRRQAERGSKTIEADMIEGKHFRNAEARRRSVAEAIDRYFADELPKKRAGDMHRHNLPWWKRNLGHLKLADVTAPILVEYRGKLLNIRSRCAAPALGSASNALPRDGFAHQHKIAHHNQLLSLALDAIRRVSWSMAMGAGPCRRLPGVWALARGARMMLLGSSLT
jgi:hypothetical protein